jgi:hypothetical protein
VLDYAAASRGVRPRYLSAEARLGLLLMNEGLLQVRVLQLIDMVMLVEVLLLAEMLHAPPSTQKTSCHTTRRRTWGARCERLGRVVRCRGAQFAHAVGVWAQGSLMQHGIATQGCQQPLADASYALATQRPGARSRTPCRGAHSARPPGACHPTLEHRLCMWKRHS